MKLLLWRPSCILFSCILAPFFPHILALKRHILHVQVMCSRFRQTAKEEMMQKRTWEILSSECVLMGSEARSCSVNRRLHVAIVSVRVSVCVHVYVKEKAQCRCVCVTGVIVCKKGGGGGACMCLLFVCTCACVCTVCSCTESVLAFSMPSELGITVWQDFFFFFPHVYYVKVKVYTVCTVCM